MDAFPAHFTENHDVVEAYDPKMDTWTAKSPMPTRRGGMVSGVAGALIYNIGGLAAVGTQGIQFFATVEA